MLYMDNELLFSLMEDLQFTEIMTYDIFNEFNDCVCYEGVISNIIQKLKTNFSKNTSNKSSKYDAKTVSEENKKQIKNQLDSIRTWDFEEAKKSISSKGFVPVKSMSEYISRSRDFLKKYDDDEYMSIKKIGSFQVMMWYRDIMDDTTSKSKYKVCTDIFILCKDNDGRPDRVIGFCYWTVGGNFSVVPGNAPGHTTNFTM